MPTSGPTTVRAAGAPIRTTAAPGGVTAPTPIASGPVGTGTTESAAASPRGHPRWGRRTNAAPRPWQALPEGDRPSGSVRHPWEAGMDLVALAKNPVPSGAACGTFKGQDKIALRFARWEATRGPRRGTVCLFHGRGEFIEKYFEVVADLRRRGFAVATMDWRGQGGSARLLANPRKGYVRSFADYDQDLAAFMKEAVLSDCQPPFTRS